jgi:hypothetical protein
MRAAIVAAQSDGKEGVAFGDLFMADVRQGCSFGLMYPQAA